MKVKLKKKQSKLPSLVNKEKLPNKCVASPPPPSPSLSSCATFFTVALARLVWCVSGMKARYFADKLPSKHSAKDTHTGGEMLPTDWCEWNAIAAITISLRLSTL